MPELLRTSVSFRGNTGPRQGHAPAVKPAFSAVLYTSAHKNRLNTVQFRPRPFGEALRLCHS